jgi:hypothetical protein
MYAIRIFIVFYNFIKKNNMKIDYLKELINPFSNDELFEAIRIAELIGKDVEWVASSVKAIEAEYNIIRGSMGILDIIDIAINKDKVLKTL